GIGSVFRDGAALGRRDYRPARYPDGYRDRAVGCVEPAGGRDDGVGSVPPLKPIRKILVANRGEIARRVFLACDELGIATVAVYSEADRDAPHVREAREAVFIGPAPSRESYLSIPKMIAAAGRTGADAIH